MSTEEQLAGSTWARREIDVTVPHPARRYDYWLGGKDNFAADRESGDAVAAAFPTIRTAAIENRRFLGRAVRHLAAQEGIDQFLDVGTGIPSADNTHEVAQAVTPSARVVYVDNDPIVLAHARALLTSTHAEGRTAYLDADLRDPASILGSPELATTLDLTRPVALMLIAVLHFIADDDKPYELVNRLVEALPAGSFLAMTHVTSDYVADSGTWGTTVGATPVAPFRARSFDEFEEFFSGHTIVDPGIVPVSEWRADDVAGPRPRPEDVSVYGAVARIGR